MSSLPQKTDAAKNRNDDLFGIQWHITDNCDQRCSHCYIFAENRTKPLISMDFERMKEVLQKVEDFTGKLGMRPNFAITGGDPILAPDFWKLMDLLREKHYSFSLMGNPFHLTPEVLKRLKESGCVAYQLSIDGMEETHDKIRKPGSFQKTIETIPMIVRSGIQSIVMMTVSDMNYMELRDVMDTVENAGADAFGFARYVPTAEDKSVGIPPLEYRKVLDVFAKKRMESIRKGSFTRFVVKDHLLTLYYYEEGKFHPPEYTRCPGEAMTAGCHCGNGTLAIRSDGTVMACRRMESSDIGNLFEEDLMEMWNRITTTYRRYDEFEICSKCKISPWCRGCPAIAAATTGSFLGRDPQCWHVVEE